MKMYHHLRKQLLTCVVRRYVYIFLMVLPMHLDTMWQFKSVLCGKQFEPDWNGSQSASQLLCEDVYSRCARGSCGCRFYILICVWRSARCQIGNPWESQRTVTTRWDLQTGNWNGWFSALDSFLFPNSEYRANKRSLGDFDLSLSPVSVSLLCLGYSSLSLSSKSADWAQQRVWWNVIHPACRLHATWVLELIGMFDSQYR